jgi:hypothetical protein
MKEHITGILHVFVNQQAIYLFVDAGCRINLPLTLSVRAGDEGNHAGRDTLAPPQLQSIV